MTAASILFHCYTSFMIAIISAASLTPTDHLWKDESDVLQNQGKRIRFPRNALPPNSDKKWDKHQEDGKYIIPYLFADKYSDKEKSEIVKAMEKIGKNTCVTFKRKSTETDYIVIVNEEYQCSAPIGRRPGKNTVLFEKHKDCINKQQVMINLLRLIGLNYEHTREDRDKYIKIHYENIMGGTKFLESDFMKVGYPDASTYNVPYDYRSIMHPMKDSFAKEGTITFETLDPAFQNVIGTANEPSVNDYKKVCLMYNCNKCTGKPISITYKIHESMEQ